jgi:hypothetical protein
MGEGHVGAVSELGAAGVRATPFLVEPDGTALTRIAELIDAGTTASKSRRCTRWPRSPAPTPAGCNRTRGKLVLHVAS